MADENHPNRDTDVDDPTGDPADEPGTSHEATADEDGAAQPAHDAPDADSETQDPGDEATSADEPQYVEDDVDPSEWRRVLLSKINGAVMGTLVAHFPERDVTLYVDGDAALRILKIMESGRASSELVDHLDPSEPVADRGWIVLRPDEALALSWLPVLPKGRSKPVAIDPAPIPSR